MQGARPFMDWSTAAATVTISSADYDDEESPEGCFSGAGGYGACSLRYTTGKRVGASSSSRFSFTVSGHFDSLKPWYLSRIDETNALASPSPALVSPLNARSYSFSSPSARSARRLTATAPVTPLAAPRTPRPSFLPSPAAFFRKDGGGQAAAARRSAFLPYLRFYRRPYDEMVYRSRMRPPLGGLISIVSPSVKRRGHSAFDSSRRI